MNVASGVSPRQVKRHSGCYGVHFGSAYFDIMLEKLSMILANGVHETILSSLFSPGRFGLSLVQMYLIKMS